MNGKFDEDAVEEEGVVDNNAVAEFEEGAEVPGEAVSVGGMVGNADADADV